jgi:hypothetical protein
MFVKVLTKTAKYMQKSDLVMSEEQNSHFLPRTKNVEG